jgi:hypothetical protein
MYCPQCNQPVSEAYRFCPECGSQVVAAPAGPVPSDVHETAGPVTVTDAPEEKLAAAAAASECPIALEVMRSGSLRTGDRGLLQVRLTNRDPKHELFVELDVTSSLKLMEPSFFELELDPGESVRNHQPFSIVQTGQHRFTFKVAVANGKRERFEGQTQNNEGRFNVGNEMGLNLNLGKDQASGPAQEFIPVPLARPGRVRTRQLKRVFKGFEHVDPYKTSRMCLHFHTAPGVTRTYCILAQQRASVGKQRGRDIVLRTLPPSPENNQLTQRISREHAHIEFDAIGAVWHNAPRCSNGTIIDEVPLQGGESALLRQGSVIRVAEALTLTCGSYYNDPVDNEPGYARFCEDLGAEPGTEPLGNARAVRLVRNDELAETEQYLLIQRGVSIGSGPTCPIHLNDPTVGPIHAHVVHLAGSFWLEAAQTLNPTLVEGNELPRHRLVPLKPNSVFQLGNVVVTATAWQQYYLDVMPAQG